MSFNWNEYFDLAQELAGPLAAGKSAPPPVAGQEARCRCAISRAYYAAFIRARNHLIYIDSDLHVPRDGSVHFYVRTQFQRSGDRRRKRIGVLLDNLRFERNKVDYEDVVPGILINTNKHLAFAQEILTALDRL